MTAYWTEHKLEIIVWSIVGILFLIFLFWCFYPQPTINARPATPVLHPHTHPAVVDIELVPLPRAFLPVPLYENHERDLWVPNNAELEKRADGHYYPKWLGEIRHLVSDNT